MFFASLPPNLSISVRSKIGRSSMPFIYVPCDALLTRLLSLPFIRHSSFLAFGSCLPSSPARGMGEEWNAAVMLGESGDRPAAPPQFLLVGTGRSIPGRTSEDGACAIMSALHAAAEGEQVLHPSGQRSGWLHKRFLFSQLGIGLGTWKHFKRTRAAEIELDKSQLRVRLKVETG